MILRKLQSNNLELKTEYSFKGSVDSYLRTATKDESEEEVTYDLEGSEEDTWYSWINRYNKEHFRVLDTDYDNWALLLFSRSRYFVVKDSWGIILSRQPRLDNDQFEALIKRFDEEYEIERKDLVFPV